MELKHFGGAQLRLHHRALIVPYGIETSTLQCYQLIVQALIVPYGIETTIWISW